MNKPNFHVLVMILLFSCLQVTTSFSSLVPLTCKDISRTDPVNVSYESCVSIIEADPRSHTSTTPQLARISFELGISKSQAITSTIDELLKRLASDGVAKNSLRYCSSIYSGVPGELGAAIEALKAGTFDTADARVGATVKATITCRQAIKDVQGNGIVSLRQEINDFYQIGAICLGFIKLSRTAN